MFLNVIINNLWSFFFFFFPFFLMPCYRRDLSSLRGPEVVENVKNGTLYS
jgi:hypothetical protein